MPICLICLCIHGKHEVVCHLLCCVALLQIVLLVLSMTHYSGVLMRSVIAVRHCSSLCLVLCKHAQFTVVSNRGFSLLGEGQLQY